MTNYHGRMLHKCIRVYRVILKQVQDDEEWQQHPKSSLSILSLPKDDKAVAVRRTDGGACNGEPAPSFPSRKRAGWAPLPLQERVAQTYERAR